MQIKNITINREDINKNNVANDAFCYGSVVNNCTSNTSEAVIELTAAVLYDIHQSMKEDTENEAEKITEGSDIHQGILGEAGR